MSSNQKEIVTVLQCTKTTPNAFLLKMYGKNRTNGQEIEFETWWPKSQVDYREGEPDAEVPVWLLQKKMAELYGDSAVVEIY